MRFMAVSPRRGPLARISGWMCHLKPIHPKHSKLTILDVYQTVKREMGVPSRLLEHVGERICNALLAGFPAMEEVTVCVSKLNPPLGGQLESVSVEVTKGRTR